MPENLETINQFLADNFGIDTDDSEPIWRVVWSDDQREMRETLHTDSGIELLSPEVRELPKYPWIKHAYVLERRVVVPDINLKELPATKKSYEPIWVFLDRNGIPLRPTIQAAKFVVDTVYAAQGKSSMAKYKDPEAGLSPEESYDRQQARIDKIQEELFGDESSLGGETHKASGSAIIMPGNYDKIH